MQGHERAITQIKYNREGDLLFTAAKDKLPNVWFSINGERLGTYNGHQGTIWCIDIDCKPELINTPPSPFSYHFNKGKRLTFYLDLLIVHVKYGIVKLVYYDFMS